MKNAIRLGVLTLGVLCGFSASGQTTVPGDFTGDGQLQSDDIDQLARVIVAGHDWFDLNGDGIVDRWDRNVLVEELMQTWMGDVNLDGGFNTMDLVQMFQAGEYDDGIPGNSTWAEGDVNGDGDFDSGDLVASLHTGYECGPRDPNGTMQCRWETFGSGTLPRPLPGTSAWAGDLDLDMALTAADIDFLSEVVREGVGDRAQTLFLQRGFDLNGDQVINSDDHRFWVQDLKLTWFGDANLDGQLGTEDMVLAFQSGKFEQPEFASWAEGDWNGDLEFDSADLVQLFGQCGYDCCPFGDCTRAAEPVSSVPEPARIPLLEFAIGAYWGISRIWPSPRSCSRMIS